MIHLKQAGDELDQAKLKPGWALLQLNFIKLMNKSAWAKTTVFSPSLAQSRTLYINCVNHLDYFEMMGGLDFPIFHIFKLLKYGLNFEIYRIGDI